MAMNGIDISSYQGSLGLDTISYDFVLIKATEGTSYINPACDTHYQQAKASGKKRATYHFTNFGDPIAEADFFVGNTLGYVHDSIPVLDWEGAGVADVQGALAWLRHVRDRYGYKPAIYMSEWVENAYDWSPVVAEDFGLIIAKYSDYEIDNNYDMSNAGQPPVVKHWDFYFMWQWTSKGHLNGYAGDLDCDIAYIDGTQWDAYAGVIPTTTTTTTEAVPAVETGTTTTTTLGTTTTTTTDTQPQAAEPVTTTTTTLAAAAPATEVTSLTLFEAVLFRAVSTFWQAFLAVFATSVTGLLSGVLNIHSFNDAKAFALSTAVAVVAAALSALKNTIIVPKEAQK